MNYPCKLCGGESLPKYALPGYTVFACQTCDLHATNCLDSYEHSQPLDERFIRYIEQELHSNRERIQNQVDLARLHCPQGSVLDIGCGGGAFIQSLNALGYECSGLEVHRPRYEYCLSKGLRVFQTTIESFDGKFDLVTLWDVIEHVNDPKATLKAAHDLLNPGGTVMLDTPSRNSMFYKMGEFTYRISGGKYPTLLSSMYSPKPFGHKQIFTDRQLESLLSDCGFTRVDIRRKFELSFSVDFYLRNLLKSKRLASVLKYPSHWAIYLMRLKNKAIAVAKKE